MSAINHSEALSTFQALNRTRIERLSALLPIKAHFFLEILPLLFQTNSPVLPGYISQDTPVGIVDFQPSNTALDAARAINHAFQYQRRSLNRYPLHGLYLINDNGLLNYHPETPFELWLIYVKPITSEGIEALNQKMTAICEWAYSALHIKINGRLLYQDSLAESITPFDLDRLYHSGIVLAGLPPSWWSSLPENDVHPEDTPVQPIYDNHNAINFGVLASTVDSMHLLLKRTLNTIEMSMGSDLETCLTLIYQHYLLKSYPNFSWLSHQLKQAIYDGVTDPLLLDTNRLRLNYISTFCDDSQALLIAQQSFYILGRERLSKQVSQAAYPSRRVFIEQLHKSWHWPDDMTDKIDKRGLSHYRQAFNECEDVRMQITKAMASAVLFAQQHNINIEIAKQAIDKQFNIIFNTDQDAIHCLPVAFMPKNHEEHLYLGRTSLNSNWRINDLPESLSKEPLYQHPSLLNVLAWAVNNQLLNNATRIQVVDQAKKVKTSLVLDLIQQLLHSPLSTEPDEIKATHVNQSTEIDSIILFANLEHQVTTTLSQQGLELSSLQTDPLNYANSKQCLIASIEGLVHSTLGHWHYVIHTGTTSLLALLDTIIKWQPTKPSALKVSCWCPSDSHGKKISDRIESVYKEVMSHYLNHPLSGDYLIAIADQVYRLQWQQGLVDILPLAKNKSLEQHLAEDRDVFSVSKLDPSLDKKGLFQLLLSQQVSNRISLFLSSKNNAVTLYIVDDLGTLLKQETTGLTEATLISHYRQFFSKLTALSNIQFFHLTHSTHSGWKHTQITSLNGTTNKSTYLPVSIELDSLNENAHCNIHCGPKTFTGRANDPSLFKQVSDFVLNLRNSSVRYPLYINQLSFTVEQRYMTRHYIKLKQHIERLLNRA